MKKCPRVRSVLPFVCGFSLLFLLASMGLYAYYSSDEDSDCSQQLKNITTLVEYRGLQIYSVSLTESLKRQVDALMDCGSLYKDSQPTIVVGTNVGSYYTKGCNIIHMNDGHGSLLVHEYIHYLDFTLFNNNLSCSLELFSQMEHGPGTAWGDGRGYAYCYKTDPLPNHKEYLAVMGEGYCTNECGPTRSYFENASNPIAVRQLECLKNFV